MYEGFLRMPQFAAQALFRLLIVRHPHLLIPRVYTCVHARRNRLQPPPAFRQHDMQLMGDIDGEGKAPLGPPMKGGRCIEPEAVVGYHLVYLLLAQERLQHHMVLVCP